MSSGTPGVGWAWSDSSVSLRSSNLTASVWPSQRNAPHTWALPSEPWRPSPTPSVSQGPSCPCHPAWARGIYRHPPSPELEQVCAQSRAQYTHNHTLIPQTHSHTLNHQRQSGTGTSCCFWRGVQAGGEAQGSCRRGDVGSSLEAERDRNIPTQEDAVPGQTWPLAGQTSQLPTCFG